MADAQSGRDLSRIERQRAEAARETERLQSRQRLARAEIAALTRQLVEIAQRRAASERAAAAAEQRLAALRAQQARDGALYAADSRAFESLVIAAAFAARRDDRGAVRARMFAQAAAPALASRLDLTARALAQARRLETDIAIEQANLAAAQIEIDAERARAASVLAQQRALSATLAANLERARARAARLAREARSLRDLADRASAGEAPRAGAPRGGDVPAAWTAPATGRVLRTFGSRIGAGPPAQGVTLGARAGGQVVAPASGEIAYAGPFRGYGNVLILNVAGGYAVVLAGMDSLRVRAGETVAAGQPVGEMPATAAASDTPAPELYVEVRRDGRPIDPGRWLAARGVAVAQAN